MAVDYTYFVKIVTSESVVKLILETDTESSSDFGSADDERTTYELVSTVSMQEYETLKQTDDKWKNAKIVDENYIFYSDAPGAWCSYTYAHEGTGHTRERTPYPF